MASSKIIVGNMKMNLTLDEVKTYINSMKGNRDFIICPSSLYLTYFIEKGFNVGIQNISEYNMGAYTGEISGLQAVSMNIKYTIIGHSERRNIFSETDSVINQKVKNSLSNNLGTILCIGETLEDKKSGKAKDILMNQIMMALKDINSNYYHNLIIAYEPVWAIGTGILPNNQEIEEIVSFIKDFINSKYGFIVKVLYGGSVNEKNIEKLRKIDVVNGFLVGNSCLEPEKFLKIIETVR